jgi:uncharacterized LabA/DUF88 family protein
VNNIAIFVDVQNIYYTTRQAYQRQFNYRELWQQVKSQGNIVTAYAYAIERNDEKQRQFQNTLRQIGFTVKLKPYIQRSDGSSKGDWDVGITIDMLEACHSIDKAVLLSGDGDFDLLLKHAHEKYAVDTEVYGVPSLTAASLIQTAKNFHPIDTQLLL